MQDAPLKILIIIIISHHQRKSVLQHSLKASCNSLDSIQTHTHTRTTPKRLATHAKSAPIGKQPPQAPQVTSHQSDEIFEPDDFQSQDHRHRSAKLTRLVVLFKLCSFRLFALSSVFSLSLPLLSRVSQISFRSFSLRKR